jgi:DNA (cytosine-5)-methyltransferase 1
LDSSADERHLWPYLSELVRKCQPSVVFGEQVASKDGRLWLDGVQTDLERMAYAVGAADLCAAGVGAPHIRQRLYWVADVQRAGLEERQIKFARQEFTTAERSSDVGGLEYTEGDGRQQRRPEPSRRGAVGGCGWGDFDVIPCIDGKARRVEAGTFPLVNGTTNRVGLLRGYGNAIVPQVAAEFIKAFFDVRRS